MLFKKSYLIILLVTVPSYVLSMGYVKSWMQPSAFKTMVKNGVGLIKQQALEEAIINDAYKNMPPELKQCSSPKDILNVLNKQHDAAFNNMLKEYKVPFWRRWQLKRFIAKEKSLANKYYKNALPSDKLQREIGFDSREIKFIEKTLREQGINPNSVHIICDKKSEYPAYAMSALPSFGKEAKLHFTSPIGPEVGCHEISHLIYHDNLETMLLLAHLIEWNNKKEDILKNKAYQNYQESIERRANNALLLDPKNKSLLKNVYKNYSSLALHSNCNGKWNATEDDRTHPDFCNRLMWFIKSWELANKQPKNKL